MMLTDRQRQAIAYFVSMGWTAPQSAGIVANLWTESRLNPEATGDGGQAYGIAQWHPDRQAGFAAIIGHDIRGSTLEEQLAYVHAELHGSEKAAGEALGACTTARDAGATVSRRYERPADTEGEAARRGALAQSILDEYSKGESMADQEPSVASTISNVAATALPLLGPWGILAGGLIKAFSPLFQEKLAKEIGRHTDSPETAQQIAQNVIQVAQDVTGKDDPVQAVAAVQNDPAIAKQVEDTFSAKLSALQPFLDKIEEGQKQAAELTTASEDAASARAGTADLRPMLARNIWAAVMILAILLGAAIVAEIILKDDHKPESDLMVSFTGMVTYLLARLGDVYGWGFGGVQKNAVDTTVQNAIAQK